jgi:hypothetical protein
LPDDLIYDGADSEFTGKFDQSRTAIDRGSGALS